MKLLEILEKNITVPAQIIKQTSKAYLVYFGKLKYYNKEFTKETVWIPKSLSRYDKEKGEIKIPKWFIEKISLKLESNKLNKYILNETSLDSKRFWIDSHGKAISVRSILHSEYAERIFGSLEDPMKLAEKSGWIRLTIEHNLAYVECIRNKVNNRTFISLKDEIRQDDSIFIVVVTDDHYYKEYDVDTFLKRQAL